MRVSLAKIGLIVLAIACVIAAIVLGHHFIPRGWLSTEHLSQVLRSLRHQRLGALYAVGVFALLTSAFVPVTALIAATALVFAPVPAFVCSLCGSLLSAALSYGLGRLAKGPVLRRMRGPKLSQLREALHAHAFSATVAARVLPVGNFAAINLLAGAVAVPWLPFVLGNVCGMIFGIASLTLLMGRLAEVIAKPTPANIAVAVPLLCGVVALSFALTRYVARRHQPPE
jgi:uncharacterized membrane protein YdjX (TVP38/TMEM64 family)